jgi:hypothetical protein
MKSNKKAAFVLFAAVTVVSVGPTHAQQRRTNFPMPSYTPRPVFQAASRPEPRQQPRFSQPESRIPNRRPVPGGPRSVHPENVTPTARHAGTYNSRPGGIHIRTEYFAAHYGRQHLFHFNDRVRMVFGGESYLNFDGAWFGIVGQVPGDWAFQSDNLYIGLGDDGNYYLYDASSPDSAVQLTFVQNVGDDQAGADDDEGN